MLRARLLMPVIVALGLTLGVQHHVQAAASLNCPGTLDGLPLAQSQGDDNTTVPGYQGFACSYYTEQGVGKPAISLQFDWLSGPVPNRPVAFNSVPACSSENFSSAELATGSAVYGDFYSKARYMFAEYIVSNGLDENAANAATQQILNQQVAPVADDCNAATTPQPLTSSSTTTPSTVPGTTATGGYTSGDLDFAAGLIMVLLGIPVSFLIPPWRKGSTATGSLDPDISASPAPETDTISSGAGSNLDWPQASDEQINDLQDFFNKTRLDKMGDHVVRNPTLVSKAWHNTGGLAVEEVLGQQGGQCGEFAKWGVQWTQDWAKENFGPETIVDELVLDPGLPINHAATRIILPDGRRFILDYWEAMGRSSNGAPHLVTENAWISKWRGELIGPGHAGRTIEENNLKHYVEKFGEHDGIDAFRKFKFGNHAVRETIIRSWMTNPW